jgi:arylsulfatase A-like enzyme
MIVRPAAALVVLGTLACAPSPPRPSVVLLVVDTLRADRLGAWGSPRGATPHLDALARAGTSFSRAYAAATWTLPSVASMLTGLHPTTLAATQFRSRIPEAVDTLAERLRREGYGTAAVVSHILVGARAGFAEGFDDFDEEEIGGPGHVSSPGVTARGERLLRALAARGKPFFLFLHYFDPHYEFVRHPEYGWAAASEGRLDGTERRERVAALDPPPTEEEIAFLAARYDEEVRFTDAAIGRFLRTLESLDLDEETIVVVTSDHGEELWDHGQFGHGGTQSLHEEVVRVPLIVRTPANPPAVVPATVSLVSVTPTVLDLADLPAGDDLEAAPLDDPPAAEAVLCEFVFAGRVRTQDAADRGVRRAWIGARHKLVEDEFRGEIALFDLQADPAERADLSAVDPARAAALAEALRSRVAELLRVAHAPETMDMTGPQRERLEALGYVGN